LAVLYVVQRMESLSHTFVFAGLWLYVWGRQRQLAGAGGWPAIMGGVLGGSALGVLSKESAILLPLYAFVLEACVFRFRMPKHSRIGRGLSVFYVGVLLLPALVGASVVLPRYLSASGYGGRDFSLMERLLTESRVLLDYLRWSVLPDLRELSLYHDDFPISHGLLQPSATLFSLLALAALIALAWLCRRRRVLSCLGILWFLAAHLLTATVIPLELMFEHRNYFASLGICLVLADWLLFAPTVPKLRQAGALVAVVYVVLFAGLTHLRALEWSHPLRFAITEVAKHPKSPRATYDLARNLVGLTHYKADSPYLRDAWQALERARLAPRSTILPNQAALILAARTGSAQDRIWWDDMQVKLRLQALSASNIASLGSLTSCAVEDLCQFNPNDMLATFNAALEAKTQPAVLSIFGKYSLYELHDPQFALRLWKEAADKSPTNGQFQINLAMLQIDLAMYGDAQVSIDKLRKLSRIGRYDQPARELELAIHRARALPPQPGQREATKLQAP
jgi:tetratricopeptide (TPR) repeat protein